MRRVYSSADPTAIEIVRSMLREAGIESMLLNQATGAVLGDVPFFLAAPEVWVARDEDAERARGIVERFESGEARDELPTQPWQCPECGELVEGQFTACWRCDAPDPRDDPEARCEECGYLLRGLPERRCPECGTIF